MKREAIGHTKMKRLCVFMDIPQWQAVGLLESLWWLTAREAYRGDIGKLSNEDIAIGIDYRGDADALIHCLIRAKWVDVNDEHRLIIHDWSEHADDAIQVRIARAHEYFADGRAPKLSKLARDEKEAARQHYGEYVRTHDKPVRTTAAQVRTNGQIGRLPEPEPVPVPEPDPEPEPFPPIAPQGAFGRDRLRQKPHPIHDADWFEFRAVAEQVLPGWSEKDWQNGFVFGWRSMDPEKKQLARANITHPHLAESARKSAPVNFLQDEKFMRIQKAAKAAKAAKGGVTMEDLQDL